MNRIKLIIVKVICSDVAGRIIAFLTRNLINYRGVKISTNYDVITPYVKACLFWQIYESSEARFIDKYLTDKYDVIELGGSIGCVSSLISKKINEKRLFIVEANPSFAHVIKDNLSLNHFHNFQVLSNAISYNSASVRFSVGKRNTGGRITDVEGVQTIEVPAVSLQQITETYLIDHFVLVCDIEGAEFELVANDKKALEKCKMLIIEMHDYKNFKAAELITALVLQGFTLKEQHGNNAVFIK